MYPDPPLPHQPSASLDHAWLLLRHAPTKGPDGRFVGRSDRAIQPVDPDEIARLVAAIGRVHTVVVTSLRRTRLTLDLLLQGGLPAPAVLRVEPELAEQDFGDWEEQGYDELAARDPAYWPYWDDPVGLAPPGGESFEALCRRVVAAQRRLAGELSGPVLHVGHAGPIRALLGQALEPASALTRSVETLSLHRMQAG